MEKLEKLGMSEEEWNAKKKQIQSLREKVRRAKFTKDHTLLAERQKELNEALANAEKPGTTPIPPPPSFAVNKKVKTTIPVVTKSDSKKKEAKPANKRKPRVKKEEATIAGKRKASAKKDDTKDDQKEKRARTKKDTPVSAPAPPVAAVPAPPSFFEKNIQWKVHDFDYPSTNSAKTVYENTCPLGGPGGLVCCADCTKMYSDFLTATSTDMERQKTQQMNKEVMELLGFLSGSQSQLHEALELARSRTGSSGLTMQATALVQKNANQKKPPTKDSLAKKNSSVSILKDTATKTSDSSTVPELHVEEGTPSPVTADDERVLYEEFPPPLPSSSNVVHGGLSYELPFKPDEVDSSDDQSDEETKVFVNTIAV